jgi:HSP20 family molecular chaperone IbpA
MIMAAAKREHDPVKKTIEPVVTLSDEGNCILVTAELPEIREEMIRIDLERSTLIISASDNGRLYKKEIPLPVRIRFGTKKFRNGILELFLEKTNTR